MSTWFSSIQLGFDMATSLTIVGAAVTWIIGQKKQAEAEKIRGINQHARSTGLKKVQDVLFEIEDKYSILISKTQAFEKNIDLRVRRTNGMLDFTRLNQTIKNDSGFLVVSADRLRDIREELGQFYELIQVRRYSLIPLLDAIKDGDKYIGVFKRNIDEVGEAYNKMGSDNLSLLKELNEVIVLLNDEYGDEMIDLPDELIGALFNKITANEKIIKAINSIIFDKSYFYWVQAFTPTGEEERFLEKVVVPNKIEDMKLYSDVITNFILSLIKKNHELLSQVLASSSNSVMQARMECKDILIALSAISHKLVMDNNDESLEQVIDKYDAEGYFGRDTTIR